MKIKAFRLSGLPVELVDLDAYRKEWHDKYLALETECGKDMLTLQKRAQELEQELIKSYKMIIEVDMPKSAKSWALAIDRFQTPLMLARSSVNPKEIVLVICDQPVMG